MEVQYQVLILNTDVSDDVEIIDNIQKRIDTPNLTEYAVSDVVLTLMPNTYVYAPEISPNFFTERMHHASGYGAAVEIRAGFRGEALTTIFKGIILELAHSVGGQQFRMTVTDASALLRDETIQDFGLRKNNNLRPASEQLTIRGQFHFEEAVSPVSEGSVSGTLEGQSLTEVQNLRDEGQLSARNFQVAGQGSDLLTTELAPDDDTDVLNATYKAPLRGVGLNRAIKEVLDAYDIPPTDVMLPLMQTASPLWSHIARPAYEVESAVGTNNTPFGWNGYVTDILRNTNGDLYMLYSHRGSSVLPQLLRYTASTDSWDSILQASAHAEWWQLATDDFDTFFILQSTGTYERGAPTMGSYNPAEGNARTSILKWDSGAGTRTTFVNSGTLRPQVAVHYWYGFIQGTGKLLANSPRFGFLPDTRVGFEVAENAIWYRYASSANFGLARIRTSNGQGEAVITIAQDEFDNEASFDFTIDTTARTIYGSHTTIGDSGGTLRSRHLVYSRSMPTSY